MNTQFSPITLVIFAITGVIFLFFVKSYALYKLPKSKKSEIQLSVISPLLACLFYCIGMMVIMVFAFTLLRTTYPEIKRNILWAASFFVGSLVALVGLIGVVLIHSKEQKQKILGKAPAVQSFFKGLLAALGVYPLSLLLFASINGFLYLLLGYMPKEEQVAVKLLNDLPRPSAIFTLTVCIAVGIVPVVEELLFRGFIQNFFLRFFEPKWALIITSVFFAALHYSSTQGIANISLLIGLFFTSCALGMVYMRYNSIWTSIGMHATFNALSLLFLIT